MGTWLRRLAYLLRQSRHDAELREEIEAHRSLRAAHLEREGLTSQEAADASRRAIGNVLLAREDVHEVWLGSWGTWWQDVRYGLRTCRKNPTFTAAAVLTLALGIGVNAGIFTVLNGLLFRDLPAPNPHQLVSIAQTVNGGRITARTGEGTVSAAEYRAYRDRARTLSGLLAHTNPTETTLGGDLPQQLLGMLVSCNYFAVLQQAPTIGRSLTEQDCERGAAPVVVLGHHFWMTTFGADREIVGRSVELNRHFFTVVGVAAEGTYGGSPMRPGYYAPISADPLLGRTPTRYEDEKYLWLYLVGRRSEQARIEQVRAELAVVAAQIDRQQPGRSTLLTIERATPKTVPGGSRGPAGGAAIVLMTAFGFILLIACANVANLLLARGTARSQEIGVRLSLGATRARLVRQLLTESVLISLAGGLLGSAVAFWSFQALVGLALPAALPPEMPPIVFDLNLAPDVRVLSFAIVVTFATGVIFGLAPALHVSRLDLLSMIKKDSAITGSTRGGGRLRGTLVGVQVALSMALMIAAGLLLRGLYATYTIDPRFAYRDIAYVSFGLDGLPYDREKAVVFQQRLRDMVAALPGVEAVAYASDPPLGEETAMIPIRLAGSSESSFRDAALNAVSAGYFSLVGIPLVRGRTFTEAEIANATPDAQLRPVIVSETTARNLWPDADPIGRTLQQGDFRTRSVSGTLQVVGVAADAQVSSLGAIDSYYVYVPGGEELLVKTRSDFAATSSSIRKIARDLDPALVVNVLRLEANLGFWRGLSTMVTTLGAGLGVLALTLASIGIYGVVSYSVRKRYREIGIRMALGARARDVLVMMLRRTMRPVVVGALIGLAAASAISRILTSVLFGVSPADPIGLGGGALLVLGVALAAGMIAVRPAAGADPIAALRSE